MTIDLPDSISSVDELDLILSEPTEKAVAFAAGIEGPLVVLGAAGKMGPTLCLLARRALDASRNKSEVIAVSRFSSTDSQQWFEDRQIRTLKADLLEAESYPVLPESSNVLFLVGQKFGTSDNPSLTWAVNTIVPVRVAERYRDARIVALSTGNVYPLVKVDSGGCSEQDTVGPVGEYANACLARERLFNYAAERIGARSLLVRLNYAVELRYGVLVDIAQQVQDRMPIDVTMGYLNYIWQRDANERILLGLQQVSNPPTVLNLTGTEVTSVRGLAQALAERMDLPVEFTGAEADTALISDASYCTRLFGELETPESVILDWTAGWIRNGGHLLGKSTHFQQRDGKF